MTPESGDVFFWDRWVSRDSGWWQVWYLGTAFAPAIIVFVVVLLVLR